MNKIILILLLGISLNSFSQQRADVYLDLKTEEQKEISPYIYGGFMEMLRDFVNGSLGIWAQEISDRGFDNKNLNEFQLPLNWQPYSEVDETEFYSLKEGGYNPNGKSYIRLSCTEDFFRGIKQTVYVNPNVNHTFYFYAKSDTATTIKLKFLNPDNSELIREYSVDFNSEEWKKTIIEVNPINAHKADLVLCASGNAEVSFDELSLMPDNSIDGVRKEYYELFEEWNPRVIRYPGGWFADVPENFWELGIGDIDKRGTGIYDGIKQFQRLDFGTDEFMKFCRNLNITPHIVVNYNRTPGDAANWIEYCNGDTETEYGKKRSENGNPEPYDIFFWEVGNEQWGDETEMAQRYLLFYEAMKAKDESIEIMINGNLWKGRENFEKIINVIDDKSDIFGWHYTVPGRPDEPVPDEKIYKSVVGSGHQFRVNAERYQGFLEEFNLLPDMLFGNTEWWIEYGSSGDWLLDTTKRSSSLEAGLATAAHMITFQNYPDYYRLAERTIGLSFIRTELDKETGKKEIFGTSQYHSVKLFSNHSGSNLIPVNVSSETYDIEQLPGLWAYKHIPYIQVSATESKDSIFIAVLNADYENDREVYFHSNKYITQGSPAKIYYITSEHFLDANTFDEPEKISVRSKEIEFSNLRIFPKQSVSIIALPKENILSDVYTYKYDEDSLIINNDILYWNNSKNIQEFKVFDYLGNEISNYHYNLSEKRLEINLSGLSSGVYFLYWKNSKEQGSLKFIK